VLVVDQADRLPAVAVHRLVVDAAARGAKVVLVTGGTAFARRAPGGRALATLAGRLGPVVIGSDLPALPAGAQVVRCGRDGTVCVAPTSGDAVGQLVADWVAARASGADVTMVALGPDEARYLNLVARSRRVDRGELTGPVLTAGSRQFLVGDEVRALRHDPRLGASAGAVGVVVAVDPGRRQATIEWEEGTALVGPAVLGGRSLSHAYATTPAYLRHGRPGPVLALGLAPGLDRTSYVVGRDPPNRLRSLDPVSGLVAGLDPPVHTSAPPVGRSLADLSAERARLGAALLAAVPPDARADLRAVHEEQAWLSTTWRPDAPSRLAELDRRQAALQVARDQRAAWLADHRGAIERWATLDTAVAWRTEALAQGAELAPPAAVTARLGPAPDDERAKEAWRRAAGAIESYHDRWGPPDAPPKRHPGREVDELRLVAACRAFEQHRTKERGVDDDRAISVR
jgi:hypothetical protein